MQSVENDAQILDLIQNNPGLLETIKQNSLLMTGEYKEKPVDIIQFIEDPHYLGNATDKGKKVYKVWKDTLAEAYSKDNIIEVILTGAIGTGKSSVADIGLCYTTYNIVNLVNPYKTYGFLVGKPLSLVFFSMTLSLTQSNNFITFQNMIQTSSWFLDRGQVRGNVQPLLYFPMLEYKLCSPRAAGYGNIGGDVIGGVLDEINSPGESMGVKTRAFNAYQGTLRRMESRFMEQGKLPNLKLFLCASKDDELAFLDAHIEKRKKSDVCLVKDVAIYEAKPNAYSGVRFPVAVGDVYHPPKIITQDQVSEYAKEGYKIVELPIEHKESAEYDLIGTLRDVAGVTVAGIRKYKLFPSEKYIVEVLDKDKTDPITVETAMSGLEDGIPLIGYLDTNLLRLPKETYRCLHLDWALSGDAMTLACSGISGWMEKDVQQIGGDYKRETLPVVDTEFILRLKAKPGDQIPTARVREFIISFKEKGYRIGKFTADLRVATADTIQMLKTTGLDCNYFSVDRRNDPYMEFKQLVFEKRWSTHYHSVLFFEMKHIEFNRENGKVDHPDQVKDIIVDKDGRITEIVAAGSKDMLDAAVASVFQCIHSARAPLDLEAHKSLAASLNPHIAHKVREFHKTDWFINQKQTGGVGVLVQTEDKLKSISKVLKTMRAKRALSSV